jgi:uncharacterized protein YheU (UPF0270 family)
MSESRTEQYQQEEGIEVPVDRIDPDTLRRMIEEFVTREWADLGDDGFTLDDKIAQVLRQLHDHTAKVVYDLASESWNIVETKKPAYGRTGDE